MHFLEGLKDGTHGSFSRVDEGVPLLSAKDVRESGLRVGQGSQVTEEDANTIVANGFPRRGDVLPLIHRCE